MGCIDFTKLGYSRTQVNNLIEEWVLSERDRKIMKRRHIDGIRFEQLAEEFDISVRHVKKIVYKYDKLIFTKNA